MVLTVTTGPTLPRHDANAALPPGPIRVLDFNRVLMYLSKKGETMSWSSFVEWFKSSVTFALLLFAIPTSAGAVSACTGDFDNSGRIDFTDFLAFAAVFGKQHGDADYDATMDLDASGAIDFSDFLGFAAVFGNTCAPEAIRLTNNDVIELSPAWSPDGTQIAFLSGDEADQLWVMDVDGSNSLKLAASIALPHDMYIPPAWSPDGAKIAFSSNHDGNVEIYVVDGTGVNVRRLTNNDGEDWFPSWSPDGTKIAFSSNRDGNLEIYSADTDGANATRLTDNDADDWLPVWSPDGRKIAFSSAGASSSGGESLGIFVVDADGANTIRLTDEDAGSLFPAWSPDGTEIAFWSNRDSASGWGGDIYVMNADGTNTRRLTRHDVWDDLWSAPVWSPDGRMIAFSSDHGEVHDGQIYVMNSDGTNIRRLTDGVAFEAFPAWSPDGATIAYITEMEGSLEIYVISVTP